MNRSRRSAALAVIVVLLMASTAACRSGKSKDGAAYPDKLSIVFVSPASPSDVFWGAVANGAKQAGKDQNASFQYLSPSKQGGDAATDAASLLRAAITKKPDAIVVGNDFPDALNPLIKQASDSGIVTIVMNGGDSVKELGAIGAVGEDNFEAGVSAGERFAAEGAKTVMVPEVPGLPASDSRVAGFEKGFVGEGRRIIKVAIPLNKVTDPTSVQRAIEGSLSTNRDIDGLMALGIVIWTPARTALDQKGLSSQIKLASFDISTNALKDVEAGKSLFLVDQQPYLEGYYGVQMAAQYIRYGFTPVGGRLNTGPIFVTKDTASDVLKYNDQGVRGAS